MNNKSNDKNYSVYIAVDPRRRQIFYVGHTGNLEARIADHMCRSKGAYGARIRDVLASGRAPEFICLETHETRNEALAGETFWISLLDSRGIILCNIDINPAKRRVKRKSAKRAGLPWDVWEVEQLREGIKSEGKTVQEMAKTLNRSVGAIRSRIKVLGLEKGNGERRRDSLSEIAGYFEENVAGRINSARSGSDGD